MGRHGHLRRYRRGGRCDPPVRLPLSTLPALCARAVRGGSTDRRRRCSRRPLPIQREGAAPVPGACGCRHPVHFRGLEQGPDRGHQLAALFDGRRLGPVRTVGDPGHGVLPVRDHEDDGHDRRHRRARLGHFRDRRRHLERHRDLRRAAPRRDHRCGRCWGGDRVSAPQLQPRQDHHGETPPRSSWGPAAPSFSGSFSGASASSGR